MKDRLRSAALFGPLLVFAAAALWATDAPFRARLTAELSSNFIVFAEHGFDCLVAIPILAWSWRSLRKLSWKEWLAVLAIAVGGSALASVAFTESFHYVNPSVAILLQKVQPLVAISLAALFLRERLSRSFWLWAFVALAGAYLVSFPHIAPRLYEGEAFNPNVAGAALALLAALLWGASTVLGKFVLQTVPFQTLAALRFAVAFAVLGILNAWQGTFPAPDALVPADWLFIGIIAAASGIFSLFLYYYGLQYTRASVATIAELGFPLAAVFVNAYFLPDAASPGGVLGLELGQWIGTGLLLFSVYRLTRVNAEAETDGADGRKVLVQPA